MANFEKAHHFHELARGGYQNNTGNWESADFEVSQALVKDVEGGYSNISSDDGNWTGGKVGVGTLVGTNWGISAPTYAAYIKRTPTAADMRAMPYNTAKAIYKQDYWAKIQGDAIMNQSVANIIYDTMVQSPANAFYMTRQALANQNVKIDGAPVEVRKAYFDQDGKVIMAVNTADPKKIFDDIKAQREAMYNKSAKVQFKEGWANRLKKFVYTPTGAISLTLVVVVALGLAAYLNWDKIKPKMNLKSLK